MASNMSELEREIMNALSSAIAEMQTQAEKDMEEGLDYFYNGGPGRMYVRTGAMGRTPQVSPIRSSGKEVSFDAYLDKNYVYNSGDMPEMGQVLDLANSNSAWRTSGGAWAHPTAGNQHFWELTEENLERSWNRILSKYFSK